VPTYIYETIPGDADTEPRRFEIRQGMLEAPLTEDPETGLPVRRVITGGIEIPRESATPSPKGPTTGHHEGPCTCCRPGIRAKR
jgi:hypothetical protein